MSASTDPIIVLENVSREFQAGEQKITVLKRVSLSIQRGEMVAIVGASGSGKSTLMNIIGCLDKPSQGDVYINGVAIGQADGNRLARLRSRHIGFIFQRYHLMPYLTAGENVRSLHCIPPCRPPSAACGPHICWLASGWRSAVAIVRRSFPVGSSSGSVLPELL